MNLSYNISEKLGSYLKKIDELRTEILIYPLQPKSELRFTWDANLERILWSLAITDSPLSKPDIVKLLSMHMDSPKKKLKKEEMDALNLKKSFSYLKEYWKANPQPIGMSVIKKLYEISCRSTMGPMSGLTEYAEKRMNSFLDYLQKGQDHPVIQAGIAQAETINIVPFDNGNSRIGRLLSYLFLYKSGYDIREMIILEEFYKHDIVTYKRVLDLYKIQGNTTLWLEYFAYGVMVALSKLKESLKEQKFHEELPQSFWKLNPRQKKVLEILEKPEMKISNKDVQKMCGVSQITSSRDLSKLANLGLLLAHGKGRSVFYSKV